MREQSVASTDTVYDSGQKSRKERRRDHFCYFPSSFIHLHHTDPFDKLVNSDGLYYLPNLYHRQFKLVDELIRLRQDFPEQKILLPRPHTPWDNLIDEVKLKAKVFQEVKKFKIAERSHVSRQAKLQVQRQTLRNQQQHQYHLITNSFLAQSVLEFWKNQKKETESKPPQEPIKKEEEQSHNPIVKVRQDDIFVDREDQYYPEPQQNDLLDDLLNQPVVQKMEEEVAYQQAKVEPLSDYIAANFPKHQQQLTLEPVYSLSRRAAFRRINENLRKRLKIRDQEEDSASRSLTSASVLLSSLLKSDLECPAKYLVEPAPACQWHFELQRQRQDDKFQLRWSNEKMQRAGLDKTKIQSSLLALSVVADERDYQKIFEKNIASGKSFPPSIKSIPNLQVKHPKRYYNEFFDPEYEDFIMRYNKRNIFDQFSSKAAMIFPQNYSHDDLQDSQSITCGKIFVHPPSKVLQKLVYRVSSYKVQMGVSGSISSVNVDFNRMVIMAFLVKKYISNFGNVWNNVAQFVTMHPIFANHHVTPELVQEVYQIISKFQNQHRLRQIELWDKKVLPFDSYGSQSYLEFNKDTFPQPTKLQPMIPQQTTSDEQDFQFSNYSSIIRQTYIEDDDSYNQLEQEYAQYAKKIKQNALGLNLQSYAQDLKQEYSKICRVKGKFKGNDSPIPYRPDFKPEDDVGKIREELLATLKGEIKVGTPFRKKKNINEKNNQLVKILQALRNKNIPPTGPPQKPTDQSKNLNPPRPLPAPAAPAAKEDPARKIVQPSPDKKRLGGPSKKDRKTKDDQKK